MDVVHHHTCLPFCVVEECEVPPFLLVHMICSCVPQHSWLCVKSLRERLAEPYHTYPLMPGKTLLQAAYRHYWRHLNTEL